MGSVSDLPARLQVFYEIIKMFGDRYRLRGEGSGRSHSPHCIYGSYSHWTFSLTHQDAKNGATGKRPAPETLRRSLRAMVVPAREPRGFLGVERRTERLS